MTEDNRFESLKLKRQHLREQIADTIQDMIAADRLQPGEQLPSERELARLLGVNRATLREGLRLLEQRGLVEMRVGSGTYIKDIAPGVVGDSIERYFLFASCSHEELTTLRVILEPEMAALAARCADAKDLATLGKCVDEIEATFETDVAAYAAADAGFHDALALATHNRLIAAIARGLARLMRKWIQAQSESYRFEEGARSHRLVFEAVVARDAERAREAMSLHMRTTRAARLNGDVAEVDPSGQEVQ